MKKEKILLLLLPFWDPQIPPAGLSCLKAFLQHHEYPVKVVDANINTELKDTYYAYFDTLKEIVPEHQRGNFYKVGFDVLHNHLMAFLQQQERTDYLEAIRSVVSAVFFVCPTIPQIEALHTLVHDFYQKLELYTLPLLAAEKPDVLGISVYTDTLAASLFVFQLAKQHYPQLRTVMGGGVFASDLAMDTPNMEYFLSQTPYIDKIIVGEGELLFLQYLQTEVAATTPIKRVSSIKDIQHEILDLNQAPLPDFSDFSLQHYPYIMAYTSRSCPFQCDFCTETRQWGKYRKKSATQVATELLELYRLYGSQLFLMADSLLNPIVHELAQTLEQQETSLYWDGYLRADGLAMDRENTFLWRRGGFYRARLGMESGSQTVLNLMNKKITVPQAKAAVAALADAGIKTTTYWVVGFPGETERDFLATLDFLSDMADDIFEADCSPFWYYISAQGGDNLWQEKRFPLYPEKTRALFLLQTWCLSLEPHRDEIYRRVWRFVEHCQKLGIPNPYSLQDFHKADMRWSRLHKNAVPPMASFGKGIHYIDENKRVAAPVVASISTTDEGDFAF